MLKISLIRHARTPWNLEKKIQGRSDIGLSPEGMAEARNWANILLFTPFEVILSSPMKRARQTSRILSDRLHVDIQYESNLREQDFGRWEGRRLVDIRETFPGEIEHQESKGWRFCPPGGESRIEVLQRSMGVIKSAAQTYEGKHLLLVTHNSVIKTLIYKAMNRTFLPGEKPVLKAYHLHELSWRHTLTMENLNYIDLRNVQ